MQVTSLVSAPLTRAFGRTDICGVSLQRVMQYRHNEPEAEWTSNNPPPKDWPTAGLIEFKEYSARYRPGLELSLKRVCVVVKPGQKVGIVGRTGAGKSTMSLCLFRLMEAAGGAITIDGVDISRLGLHELRSRLTIIPQEPVLFSGSIRRNLDPTGEHSDCELWTALDGAGLRMR